MPGGHDWKEAGAAWGHAAAEWAALGEPMMTDAIIAIFERTGIGPGVDVLDVACGSGLTMFRATNAGATVSGLDASESLLDVARARNPAADIRLGSMFELPWDDESFDVVISINGIWGGCEDALREMHRVTRVGGFGAISFWGDGKSGPLDMRDVFRVLAAHSPREHVDGMRGTNGIAFPGVAEQMLTSTGWNVVERGARVSLLEAPDAETARRTWTSIGPAVPALRNGDQDAFERELLAAIELARDTDGVYRYRNDHHFVIAKK